MGERTAIETIAVILQIPSGNTLKKYQGITYEEKEFKAHQKNWGKENSREERIYMRSGKGSQPFIGTPTRSRLGIGRCLQRRSRLKPKDEREARGSPRRRDHTLGTKSVRTFFWGGRLSETLPYSIFIAAGGSWGGRRGREDKRKGFKSRDRNSGQIRSCKPTARLGLSSCREVGDKKGGKKRTGSGGSMRRRQERKAVSYIDRRGKKTLKFYHYRRGRGVKVSESRRKKVHPFDPNIRGVSNSP